MPYGTVSRRLQSRTMGGARPTTQTWCAQPHHWHTGASSPELLVLQWHRTRRPQRLKCDHIRDVSDGHPRA